MSEIFDLSENAVDKAAANNPLLATYAGIAGFDHLWPDLSPEGQQRSADFYASLRAEAEECSITGDRDLLAQRVLIEDCDAQIQLAETHSHEVDLNNIASPHQELRLIFGSMADQTADDWDAIVERVRTVEHALDGYKQTLEAGRATGNVVSRRQVEEVIRQGDTAIGLGSSFDALRGRLESSPIGTESHGPGLSKAISRAKEAFSAFNEYLSDTYHADANEKDAVGQERYQNAADLFLGTRLDLPETYRWGWDEVERLWRDMQTACASIDPASTTEQVLERLTTAPEYAASDLDDFVATMKERQKQALRNLAGVHFDVPDQIRNIEVRVEPEGGALAASYVGPSEDFSRAGTVWYPYQGVSSFPLFAEVTTAYHEGFPGHHLQIGVQTTLRKELSRYHRMLVWYPGSGEGWALYAEHLMGELGYLERPEYIVGLLSSQLLRAARVVIDIGLHLGLPIPRDVSFHPGEQWSFELSHELLRRRAFLNDDEATSETMRYLGWPGQAISYKVGEQAILDLREDWRSSGNFDPKRFHSSVLSVGSVGLDLLKEQVTLLKHEQPFAD